MVGCNAALIIGRAQEMVFMSSFVMPSLEEAESRLDSLFAECNFSSDHPAMQDWVAVKFALKSARQEGNIEAQHSGGVAGGPGTANTDIDVILQDIESFCNGRIGLGINVDAYKDVLFLVRQHINSVKQHNR